MTEQNPFGAPEDHGNDPYGGQPTQPQPAQPHPSSQPTQPQPVSPTQPQPAAPSPQAQGGYQAYGAYGHNPSQAANGHGGQTYPGHGQGAAPHGFSQTGSSYGAPATPNTAYGAAAAPRKSSGAKTFLLAFAGALVACVLAFGVMGAVNAVQNGGDVATVTGADGQSSLVINASDDPTLAEAVAAKCLPSVVAIDVYAPASAQSTGDPMSDFLYGYGYGSQEQDDSLTLASQGSGVVMTADGYIITNYHVVEGGSAYEVTIEGNTYEAELVGDDASSDVAVLKAKDAKDLTPVELGDSDNLTIGEWVMTLGSPFGLEQSVATGIVSATSRSQIMDASEYGSTGETTIYPNMIQTDAAINPGNSGGALVDSEGKLIGINTLITSYSGNYSGVGFAIPVNYAINLANQIIAGETPTHAQLGVSLSTVDSSTATRYGLPVETGAYVAGVNPGSGAEAAGLQVGDIVTAFDDKAVESASDLMLDVRSKNPGDKVKLTVNRGGQVSDVEVTLGDDAATQKAAAEAKTEQQSLESQQPDEGRGGSSEGFDYYEYLFGE